jgi:hypothetical protein
MDDTPLITFLRSEVVIAAPQAGGRDRVQSSLGLIRIRAEACEHGGSAALPLSDWQSGLNTRRLCMDSCVLWEHGSSE